MKPICVPCQRFYRPEKNGVWFVEGMPIGDAPPGNSEPEGWKPYKIWIGDLWKCEGCGHLTISGVGRERLSEHYEVTFQSTLDKARSSPHFVQINDC